MIESTERVQKFKQAIDTMKVRKLSGFRDRIWLRLGVALMLVGLGVAIGTYFRSHGTGNPLSQSDALVLAIGGIVAAGVGSALFLRYSIASFLRFWLTRFIYEQQSQTASSRRSIARPVRSVRIRGWGLRPEGHRLSIRNMLVLRSFELRSTLRLLPALRPGWHAVVSDHLLTGLAAFGGRDPATLAGEPRR